MHFIHAGQLFSYGQGPPGTAIPNQQPQNGKFCAQILFDINNYLSLSIHLGQLFVPQQVFPGASYLQFQHGAAGLLCAY